MNFHQMSEFSATKVRIRPKHIFEVKFNYHTSKEDNRLEDFMMYSNIQSEKAMGYSRDAVAKHLGLSWRTINRYWEMTPEKYQELFKNNHKYVLDKH